MIDHPRPAGNPTVAGVTRAGRDRPRMAARPTTPPHPPEELGCKWCDARSYPLRFGLRVGASLSNSGKPGSECARVGLRLDASRLPMRCRQPHARKFRPRTWKTRLQVRARRAPSACEMASHLAQTASQCAQDVPDRVQAGSKCLQDAVPPCADGLRVSGRRGRRCGKGGHGPCSGGHA